MNLNAQNVLEACYDSVDFPAVPSASGSNFCDLFTRDVNGQITIINTGFENAARLSFEGLIAELAWEIATPFVGATSNVQLGINYIYNNELDFTVGVGDITTLRGGIGYSKHQFTANATYRNEDFAFQVQAQYFGPALNDPDSDEDAFEFPRVDDVVYFNTSLSYSINDRIRLNLVVDNILDTEDGPDAAAGGRHCFTSGIRDAAPAFSRVRFQKRTVKVSWLLPREREIAESLAPRARRARLKSAALPDPSDQCGGPFDAVEAARQGLRHARRAIAIITRRPSGPGRRAKRRCARSAGDYFDGSLLDTAVLIEMARTQSGDRGPAERGH